MSDLVRTLRGSSATACRDWQCVAGFQVCPHDYEEIVDSLETACEQAADEIERLRAGYDAAKRNQRGAEAAYERAETEIERLRTALREIVRVDPNSDPTIYAIAREALAG